MKTSTACDMLRPIGQFFAHPAAPAFTLCASGAGVTAWARVDGPHVGEVSDADDLYSAVDWPCLVLAGELDAEQVDGLLRVSAAFSPRHSLIATWRENHEPQLTVGVRASARRPQALDAFVGTSPLLPPLDFGPSRWSVDLRVLCRALELFGGARVYRCAAREARHLIVLASDAGPAQESHVGAVVRGEA